MANDARARAHDPLPSHLAADYVERSGLAGAQQQMAAALVRKHPGLTSRELAEHGPLDRYDLARRLPECGRARWVRRGEPRRCRQSGRLAATWWPA